MLGKKYDGPYRCHHTGFKENCRKEECAKWAKVQGKHPQTGETVDMFDCADKWMPMLLVNLGHQLHQNAASVESARNAARKDALILADAISKAVKDGLPAMLANHEKVVG